MRRQIREVDSSDFDLIINYFLDADHNFLRSMGVEPKKLPTVDIWRKHLLDDLERDNTNKRFYYLIWDIDELPVGHSNINKIVFGQEAFMHLHVWNKEHRRKGNGTYFVSKSISVYFEKFELQNLYCEPYAFNPAPNKTLARIGFELVKQYETKPGLINFQQPVNRWILTREIWRLINSS